MAKNTDRPCPLCLSHVAAVLHRQEFVLAQGHPLSDGYDVVACECCSCVFADTPARQMDYDTLYAAFSKYADPRTATGASESRWDSERLRQTADTIATHLVSREASILDVGCASGGLLHKLRSSGYTRMQGLDPSLQCVRNTQEKGIDAAPGSLTALPPHIGPYDCVILSHVLEHVRDVAEALMGLHSLLHPGSIVYIEVPDALRYVDFCYAPFQEFNTEHINHFSETTLCNLLALNSLQMTAGGDKLIPLSERMYYPAIYGVFRPAQCARNFRSDARLLGAILSYIRKSSQMMEELKARLNTYVSIFPAFVVWGTGELTHKLLRYTALKGAHITAFVDSNPIHHGKVLHGVRIRAPQEIAGSDCPILISTLLHHVEIAQQIRALGLKNKILFLQES